MSTVEVTCNCGWTVKSNDKIVVRDATHVHDAVCPLLFKPDVVVVPKLPITPPAKPFTTPERDWRTRP